MDSLRNARFVDRQGNLIESGDLMRSGLFSPVVDRKKRTPEKSQEVKMMELEEKIKKLEEQLEKCKMKVKDLKYRPGGPGYKKAKQRFEMGVVKQKATKKSPKRRTSPRKSLRKAKSM